MTKIVPCGGVKCPYHIDLDIVTNAWNKMLDKYLCEICEVKKDDE